MATLTIRNLDAKVEEALHLRAARNGRSIEAEARAILVATVAPPQSCETTDLAEAIRCRFAPPGGVELEPHPPAAIRQKRDKAHEIMKRRRNALRKLAE